MDYEKQRTDCFRCAICAASLNCFTSPRETVVDTCRDSDDVITVRREMFGRDAVASYFRWHMGILVLSTDIKLIVRTVGIT